MRVVFVHGACVKDGAWWWHATGDLLASNGVSSEAPLLPSCGETGETVGPGGPGRVVELAAGHHPFLSQPDVVAALFLGI